MRRALTLALALAAPALAGGRFRVPSAADPLSFPRDHGSHDDARVEWWYVTGHLETDGAPAEGLGYQLTFFRVGLLDEPRTSRASAWAPRDLHLAHFARTDLSARAFRYAERAHRSGVGAVAAHEEALDVSNESWRLAEVGDRLVLSARDGDEELTLLLSPAKPPVAHGTNGLSRKGPEPEAVSRYVSFTRVSTAGTWRKGGVSRRVRGTSWLDHEWGPGSIGREAAGWDWFSVQLDDGRDLMLYRMRGKGGEASRFTSGTLVEKDGTARPLDAGGIGIEETARWKSPRSGATYPARWTLRVPSAGLALDVVPLLPDQELVTERSTRVTYWEGACAVRSMEGAPLGKAYVEMTGYAGAGALGTFR